MPGLPTDAGNVRQDPLTLSVPDVETEEAHVRSYVSGLVGNFGNAVRIDPVFIEALIKSGASVEECRQRLLDQVARSHPSNLIGNTIVSEDRAATRTEERDAMVDQLFSAARGVQSEHPLAERFAHCRTFSGLAREMLARQGDSRPHTYSVAGAYRALMSTSDFPLILADALNKSLQAQFEIAQTPLMRMSRERQVQDFRTMTTVRRGEFPQLEDVNENGEVRRGSIGEEGESYAVTTSAKIAGVSRQILVNDDLGAFDNLASDGAFAAANKQANVMVALLNANSGAGIVMADGDPVFDAAHANQAASAGAISTATLGVALAAMRNQRGVDGVTYINVFPSLLLVPPALETVALQYVTSIAPSTSVEVNPFAEGVKLEALVEPRLTSQTGWYVAAAGSQLNLFEHAYLTGNQGPQVETKDGWDVLGAEVRVVFDFGATAVNYRAAFRNEGT